MLSVKNEDKKIKDKNDSVCVFYKQGYLSLFLTFLVHLNNWCKSSLMMTYNHPFPISLLQIKILSIHLRIKHTNVNKNAYADYPYKNNSRWLDKQALCYKTLCSNKFISAQQFSLPSFNSSVLLCPFLLLSLCLNLSLSRGQMIGLQ